jgi:uncharacterized protein involved in exopolysaccharide biosynthesis
MRAKTALAAWRPWSSTTPFLRSAGVLLAISLSPATAQDIRGMEICTAEKQMDRRTACLQANVEFLQEALTKLDREIRDRSAATDRALTDARVEIAGLKSRIEQLKGELAQIKAKAEPSNKK